MTTTSFDTVAFDRGTDALLRFMTADQARAIVAYSGDDALRTRIESLATKNSNGELTLEEQLEYAGYARANNFVAVLQAKARKLLSML